MPEIYRFHGIKIMMRLKEHGVPHIQQSTLRSGRAFASPTGSCSPVR